MIRDITPLKKELDNNKIGKLEKIIITSRDPSPPSKSYLKSSGGIFRDMMIHDFDLCRYYLKKTKFLKLVPLQVHLNHSTKRLKITN